MKIFIDSGAWLALENKNDINHLQAKKYINIITKVRPLFFTNNLVLSEVFTRLIYDAGLYAVIDFNDAVNKGAMLNLRVMEISELENSFVFEELKKYDDKKLSFTDGSIVYQFKKYRFDEIFTFDHHFKQIGLKTNLD